MQTKLSTIKTFIMAAVLFQGCCFVNQAKAQKLPAHVVQMSWGFAKGGKLVGAEYSMYCSDKASVSLAARSHFTKEKHTVQLVNTTTGKFQDAQTESSATGIQLGFNGRKGIVRNGTSELLVSLGAFGRFQSRSGVPDGKPVYYSDENNMPVGPETTGASRKNSFAYGGIVQLQYNLTCNRNFTVGIAPGYQLDNNGDGLPQVALVLGRRF
jgi:hypothetical protein